MTVKVAWICQTCGMKVHGGAPTCPRCGDPK